MWLRQIAREAVTAKSCMAIVGHTSHSGPAPTNDALSLKRAAYVRQKLAIRSAGAGADACAPRAWAFARTLSAAAPTTAFDVLDRRVEFKIVPCG